MQSLTRWTESPTLPTWRAACFCDQGSIEHMDTFVGRSYRLFGTTKETLSTSISARIELGPDDIRQKKRYVESEEVGEDGLSDGFVCK